MSDDELSPILRSALAAFYEVGYHGTSVRDIARRTGLTVPALYYHHENKEAILYTLLDGSIDLVIDRCRQAVADAPDEPGAVFRNLVGCLARYMVEHGQRAAMDAEIRALGPANRARYAHKRSVVEAMVEDAIVIGVRDHVFTVASPHQTMRALLGMIWAITVWYRPDGTMSAAEVAASYVDIALHTVGFAGAP
ncbi:TetR/AcrR family transcriptional regulator [uncultured Jatrophihabitans sp.]|uniref:TetR/AcrR family transcriptional regulator n=1 Tax=uncultured Jatrophihabitans sp. TaxID=1610747 RepID=UPI0035CB5813